MTHLRMISQKPHIAQEGRIDPIESIILVLLSVFFGTYDNFPTVIQNLQKFYRKTP